jgi:hypothetical protein
LDASDDTLNHNDLFPERHLYNFASAQHPQVWPNDTNDANNNSNKFGSIFFSSNAHFDSSNPLDNNHCNASSTPATRFGNFLKDFCWTVKWQHIATTPNVARACECKHLSILSANTLV